MLAQPFGGFGRMEEGRSHPPSPPEMLALIVSKVLPGKGLQEMARSVSENYENDL